MQVRFSSECVVLQVCDLDPTSAGLSHQKVVTFFFMEARARSETTFWLGVVVSLGVIRWFRRRSDNG
jgi:hypothetical protein